MVPDLVEELFPPSQAESVEPETPDEPHVYSSSIDPSPSAVAHDVPAPEPADKMPGTTNLSPAAQLDRDLVQWEKQMATANNAASAGLEQRIAEILTQHKTAQIEGVGNAMLVQLDELVISLEKSVRNKIISTVRSLPDDPSEDQIADLTGKLTNRIRLAGQKIKAKVQEIQEWRDRATDDLTSLVGSSLDETMDTIANIRDLRLQEIGRKWASNDALVHSDWTKYNKLKKSQTWLGEVNDALVRADPLEDFAYYASEVVELALHQAEDAALQLGQLKDAAKQKLAARDASDNFDSLSESDPDQVGQDVLKVPEEIEESDPEQRQSTEADAFATSSLVPEASDLSETDFESASEPGEVIESTTNADLPSSAEDTGDSATDSVKSFTSRLLDSLTSASNTRVPGGAMAQEVPNHQPIIDDVIEEEPIPDDSYSARVQSMVNNVSGGAQSLTQAVQDALKSTPTSQGSLQSATSVASERLEAAMSAASSVLYGVETTGVLPTYISGQYDAAVSA